METLDGGECLVTNNRNWYLRRAMVNPLVSQDHSFYRFTGISYGWRRSLL